MSYKELSLEDLYLQMQDDLYDGLRAEIPLQVQEALERGKTPQEILDQGLVAGMDIAARRHDGHRHGEGRHPRHRQEPGGDDDGGRGLRSD
jgi:methanogenic corrinoid protein MtbC1